MDKVPVTGIAKNIGGESKLCLIKYFMKERVYYPQMPVIIKNGKIEYFDTRPRLRPGIIAGIIAGIIVWNARIIGNYLRFVVKYQAKTGRGRSVEAHTATARRRAGRIGLYAGDG